MAQKYNNLCEQTNKIDEISLYAIIKLNLNQLKMMSDLDIPAHYYRYIPMYEDYLKMQAQGDKKAYIVLCLAEKYNVSDSTVKRVLKALSSRVKV